MRRALLPVVLCAVAVAPAADALAAKAKPKPISKTVPYRDATPDPTGMAVGPDSHCSGLVPKEAPYQFKAPAAGSLRVTLGGFQGEWALELRTEKGQLLTETDTTGAYESLTVKVKKPGVVNIQPCNLAGTPDGVINLVFTYA